MTFYPVHSSAIDNPDYENGLMIGNGPYMLESPRTDTEIVLVKNEAWAGDINGETWDDRLDKITFRVGEDPDSSYNSFEAGEGHNATVPPGRWGEAKDTYPNAIRPAIGTRYLEVSWDDPVVGGEDNQKLREAISQAINREEISEAVYNGTNEVATSLIPRSRSGRTPATS
jgi:ABC-type transport system substrate-binding protein